MTSPYLAMITPLGGEHADNSLPTGMPGHPSQGLPVQPGHPDQGLPGFGHVSNRPPAPQEGFILVYSPQYGWLYLTAGRPDQGLPGGPPGHPGNRPPGSGLPPGVDNALPEGPPGHPGNRPPGSGLPPGVDNALPGGPPHIANRPPGSGAPRPDQGLPPAPEPKA